MTLNESLRSSEFKISIRWTVYFSFWDRILFSRNSLCHTSKVQLVNQVQKDEKVARVKTVPLVKMDVKVHRVSVVKKVSADRPVKWVSDKRVNRVNVVSLVSLVNLVDLVHLVKHVSIELYDIIVMTSAVMTSSFRLWSTRSPW